MSTCEDHYENLLASRYTWMHGAFDVKVEEQLSLLASLDIAPGAGAPAIDLGCGPGYQSIALARLGYRVTAVDQNALLLDELARNRGELAIATVRGDLGRCLAWAPAGCALVVCMGDTLTHLASLDAVVALCADLAALLREGGRLVFTWRDLSAPLAGVERFIPVRADADRIMTCFLEYEPERVIVHDLIYERGADGWMLHKSSYPKLRLSPEWVAVAISDAGFSLEIVRGGGMALVCARRASAP